MLSLLPILLILGGQAPSGRTPEAAVDLDRWQTMAGAMPEIEGPLVRLSGEKRGWTRSGETYLDGTVRLKFRRATPDADGAVVVRARVLEHDAWPVGGYRIGLHGTGAKESSGTIEAISTNKKTPPTSSATFATDLAWHELEISTLRDRVVVKIDGMTSAEIQGLEPQAGYIGLIHNKGTLEFKDMSVAEVAVVHKPTTLGPDRGAGRMKDPTLKMPRLLKEEKPVYSIGALKKKVEGTVALEVVVDETGHVIDEWIVNSLERELDLSAVGAARHWVFTPATRNGAATSIVIGIELSFTLD